MAKITTDHEEIKKWAEGKGASPGVLDSGGGGSSAKGIRLNFPGDSDDDFLSYARKPKKATWNEFFDVFENRGLAFFYDDEDVADPTMAYRFMPRKVR